MQGVDLFRYLLRKDSTPQEETARKSREEASIENIQKVVDRITLFYSSQSPALFSDHYTRLSLSYPNLQNKSAMTACA